MAKQTIAPFFTGTLGLITFYEMYGRYFARAKSSLTAERVKEDSCFIPTMQQAAIMVRASRIGSALYALVPEEYKKHKLYRTLTGQANLLIKQGLSEDEILPRLVLSHIVPLKKLRVKTMIKERKAQRRKSNKAALPSWLRRCRRLKMHGTITGGQSTTSPGAMVTIALQLALNRRNYPSWLLPDLPGQMTGLAS